MNIAVMGANSHIARGLIDRFMKTKYEVYLFTTDCEKLKNNIPRKREYDICDYSAFQFNEYDVIINCIGPGTRVKNITDYFTLTEKYDEMAIQYLLLHPKCKYITFSSGIVDNFKTAFKEVMQYYALVRLYLETKHRAFKQLNIIDLRLYSYFSEYIDLSDNYFLCDIIKAIKNNKRLIVGSDNFIRDYLHPDDLYHVILEIIIGDGHNKMIRIGSASPITKQEILDYFVIKGLKYKYGRSKETSRKYYYPETIDNSPVYTSIKTIRLGYDKMILNKKKRR